MTQLQRDKYGFKHSAIVDIGTHTTLSPKMCQSHNGISFLLKRVNEQKKTKRFQVHKYKSCHLYLQSQSSAWKKKREYYAYFKASTYCAVNIQADLNDYFHRVVAIRFWTVRQNLWTNILEQITHLIGFKMTAFFRHLFLRFIQQVTKSDYNIHWYWIQWIHRNHNQVFCSSLSCSRA